jgi:hypothetical protein
MRRRVRKKDGKNWSPEVPKTDQGFFCKGCHTWRGWYKLQAEYEKKGEAWVINWVCRECGTYVGESWLGTH